MVDEKKLSSYFGHLYSELASPIKQEGNYNPEKK